MSQITTFADALDAVERLDLESQAALVTLLNRRLAERMRERIVESVAQARVEFQLGQSKPMAAADIVREALQ